MAARMEGLAAQAADSVQVVVHGAKRYGDPACHESNTQAVLAQRLAAFCGYGYAGEHGSADIAPPSLAVVGSTPAPAASDAGMDASPCSSGLYLLPAATLVGIEYARRLGVRHEQDLFGGVVPHPFVASKCITHPLTTERAQAPDGWSHDFPRRVNDVVLPGLTAFTHEDALVAGKRLLKNGPVRIKPGWGIGGSGQYVARDAATVAARVAGLDAEKLGAYGVVIETQLDDVRTYSVGRVVVNGITASYWGTQRLVANNAGEEVYGGSDLYFVRGGFAELVSALRAARDSKASDRDGTPPRADGADDPAISLAVEAAQVYHDAAWASFPGMFASRCNYDVLAGLDGHGKTRAGVLEQSWRMGGASGAEMAALEAFAGDDGLNFAHASTHEQYGDGVDIPDGAVIYFNGTDHVQGKLTKYSLLHDDEPSGT